MFDQSASTRADLALERLGRAVDGLLALDLTSVTRDVLLTLTRGLEEQRRRLPAVDHRLIHELDSRGVAGELACRSTAVLLAQLLRVTPGEAKRRVSAAADLGPRRGMSGEPLEPLFPAAAAAQRAGTISAAHASVIRGCIDALAASVQAKHDRAVEATLVDLDPDGQLAGMEEHRRRRGVTLTGNRDGSGDLHGHLDPDCLLTWQAVLDSLARPAPSDDGVRDPRSATQRAHDALLDAGQRLLRSDTLPDGGGVPVTVILTMTAEQLATRDGHAVSAHGQLIAVENALRIADQAHVIPVVLSTSGGIESFGRDRRYASAGQRLALTARDGGCSFPHCDIPASWCQAHHVIAWTDGGRTDLANLTLVCGYHHREHQRRGWTCQMTDGRPQWSPPAWLDSSRRPRTNQAREPVPI